MDRRPLLEELAHYRAFDETEEEMRTRIRAFVGEYADCFSRALLIGHITSSCWIVDPKRERALLAWHKRLNRWLQMGGHVESDDGTLIGSALREAREESGLSTMYAVSPDLFDVDIHAIPARKDEPEHLHYDVRYLFEADPQEPLVVSAESRAVAWVELDQVAKHNADASMIRMVAKTTSSR